MKNGLSPRATERFPHSKAIYMSVHFAPLLCTNRTAICARRRLCRLEILTLKSCSLRTLNSISNNHTAICSRQRLGWVKMLLFRRQNIHILAYLQDISSIEENIKTIDNFWISSLHFKPYTMSLRFSLAAHSLNLTKKISIQFQQLHNIYNIHIKS